MSTEPDVRPLRVTVAEIDRQRSEGWPDFHPEDYCHRCGGINATWVTDSDRFNLAMGKWHEWNGIICPGCFAQLHEAASGLVTVWLLMPYPGIPQRRLPAGEQAP